MLTVARGLMPRPKLLITDQTTLGSAPVIMDSISEALEAQRTGFNTAIVLAKQNLHVSFVMPSGFFF